MEGLVTRDSPYDVPTTVARLTNALLAKNITLFATIDHAAGAAEAGLELRPTVLLIFGNPKAGTPLMQVAQTAGIDLPLKVLIWEDEKGQTRLGYNDPAWIAARHGLGSALEAQVKNLSTALETLAAAATSSR